MQAMGGSTIRAMWTTSCITRARIDEDRVISVEVNIPVKLCQRKAAVFASTAAARKNPWPKRLPWGFEKLRLVAANPLDLEASYS